jgi:hypothetical protein
VLDAVGGKPPQHGDPFVPEVLEALDSLGWAWVDAGRAMSDEHEWSFRAGGTDSFMGRPRPPASISDGRRSSSPAVMTGRRGGPALRCRARR